MTSGPTLGAQLVQGVTWMSFNRQGCSSSDLRGGAPVARQGDDQRQHRRHRGARHDRDPPARPGPHQDEWQHQQDERLEQDAQAEEPPGPLAAAAPQRQQGVDGEGKRQGVLGMPHPRVDDPQDRRFCEAQHGTAALGHVQPLRQRVESEEDHRPEEQLVGTEEQPRRGMGQHIRKVLAHAERSGEHGQRGVEHEDPGEREEPERGGVDPPVVAPADEVRSAVHAPDVTGYEPVMRPHPRLRERHPQEGEHHSRRDMA